LFFQISVLYKGLFMRKICDKFLDCTVFDTVLIRNCSENGKSLLTTLKKHKLRIFNYREQKFRILHKNQYRYHCAKLMIQFSIYIRQADIVISRNYSI
jgi:hypothetical protein